MKAIAIINKIKSIIPEQIINFFTKGHERTVRAKKNIAASLFIKGANIGISLLLVPLVLNYLDQTRYGIWLTMTSIVSWFSFMDIGLGNGLRNKFAEAKAKGEHKKARIYVSTTYAILTIISVIFFSIFFIVNKFLPWSKILNVDTSINSDLSILALIVFGSFSIKFVAQLINTVIVADQKPAIRDGINLIGRILILIAIYLLTLLAPSSLVYLGLTYTGLPVIIIIIFSLYLYNSEYKKYSPSTNYIDFKYSKDLIGLGIKFFIIQIALVVIMSTDNIIISQLYSPKLVTPYQIARKYFYIPLSIFSIIVSPFWSATTEAYKKSDYKWIKNMVKKLNKIVIIFVLIGILMLIFSKKIYIIWLGENINISYLLSGSWLLFFIIGIINGIYSNIINGFGKIKVQTYIYFLGMIINIPLSIFFAKKLNLGIEGVILATVICQSLHFIILPIQYKKLITKNAKGIWNK
jgi:O-antigen/teichoic acid export membrane protein